jgi:hydrophobic/amphiphilic exporter-1 (mainly G- bacteria), HAE1 family
MSITQIAIKRPAATIILFALLVIGGLVSYRQLSYELLPEIKVPTLTIGTFYPGSSPEEVEQSVTEKIEDVASGLTGIKNFTSRSMEGYSLIIAEFNTDANLDNLQQEAQRKINNIIKDLPANVDPPVISKVGPSEAPIMQLTAMSDLDGASFYDLMDNEILPQLQQTTGISEIRMTGGTPRELQVNINKDKLNHFGISILQVTEAIRSANADFPTGKLKSEDQQTTVRLSGKFSSIEELKNLVVAIPPNSSSIKLSDLADVADVSADASSISRWNGNNGISLIIRKQKAANAVRISSDIQTAIERLEEKYKAKGLKIVIADDTSEFTVQAADAVSHDLLLSIILVAAVMLLFLHSTRDSVIVLISIPVSILSTFIVMYALGYSLNLMTLLAMSLVIGILVDDSIVVLENISRHLKMGKNKITAAIEGRKEIGFSAIAITLVDIVVFIPIALINNAIGDIMRQYAVTIVVSSLMSLVVSFTLIPLLASRFGKIITLDPKKLLHRPLLSFEGWLNKLTTWYGLKLKWVLNHKLITTAIIVGLFIGTGAMMSMGIMGEEMIAQGDRGKFVLKLEYEKATPLKDNNIMTKRIEDFISKKKEVKTISANIAGSEMGVIGEAAKGSEYKSELNIGLVPSSERKIHTVKFMMQMKEELEQKFPEAKINTSIISIGDGTEEPIQMVLLGDSPDELYAAAEKLKKMVSNLPGANNVSLSIENGNPEYIVKLNREKMSDLGLDIATVGSTLQNAYSGNTDSKYRTGNNEYDINIRMDGFDRNSADDLSGITFINNKGQVIHLSQFAEFSTGDSPGVLERRNRRTSITLKSNVVGITTGILAKNIVKALEKDPLPKSVEYKWVGQVEREGAAFGALGLALLTGLILIYVIMVLLYNSFVYPFVVLFSIPVAIIGAFLALNLSMSSMSIFTMLGLIMLLGLVTKNAILIVDFANHKKAEGSTTLNALIDAGRSRLRPILMTTIAMVIGMLPIALGSGAGAEWKNGLAWVLVGGLTSSLLLTVFLVPMIYYVIDKLQSSKKRPKAIGEPILFIPEFAEATF